MKAFLPLTIAAAVACSAAVAQDVAVRTYVVRTGKPWRQTLSQSLRKTGGLVSPAEVLLSTKVAGRLLSLDLDGVRLEEGINVKKGDKLAVIESRDYTAQLAVARATVASAEATLKDKKREFERAATLYKEGTATAQERDQAEADYERALASLDQANAQETLDQINLDETVITAPIDGVISARHVEPGTLLTTGEKIVTITKLDPLRFQLSVPTTLFSKITLDSGIEISVDAYPDLAVTGKISRIFPVADNATRTVRIESEIQNSDRKFVPGMYATGLISLNKRENALVIPYSAIVKNADKRIVYRMNNGKAEAINVKLGIRDDAVVEVLEGLSDSDEIVVEGQHKLADGVSIKREAE